MQHFPADSEQIPCRSSKRCQLKSWMPSGLVSAGLHRQNPTELVSVAHQGIHTVLLLPVPQPGPMKLDEKPPHLTTQIKISKNSLFCMNASLHSEINKRSEESIIMAHSLKYTPLSVWPVEHLSIFYTLDNFHCPLPLLINAPNFPIIHQVLRLMDAFTRALTNMKVLEFSPS